MESPSSDSASVDAPVALEERVRLRQAKLFFAHSLGNVPSLLVAATLVAAVLLGGGTSHAVVGGWYSLVLAVAAAVAVVRHQLPAGEMTNANRLRLLRKRIISGSLLVALCGVGVFLLPSEATLPSYGALLLIFSGVVTMATLAYSVMPAYYLTLNAVTLLPMSLFFLGVYVLRRETGFLLLAVVAITWQVVVLQKALRVSRSVIEGIVLNERLQQEIIDHEHTREAINHMALHDVLTELANRRHFDETLTRSLSRVKREQSRLVLLMLDLDGFKPVNDTYGHAVGDRVLQEVATRLRSSLRASDFTARIGGDEFAVILENLTAVSDMPEVFAKLHAALASPILIGGNSIVIGTSIGAAVFPEDGDDNEALLRVADERMYADKRQHKADGMLMSSVTGAESK